MIVHAWAPNDSPLCGGSMDRGDSLHTSAYSVTCAKCVPLVAERMRGAIPVIDTRGCDSCDFPRGSHRFSCPNREGRGLVVPGNVPPPPCPLCQVPVADEDYTAHLAVCRAEKAKAARELVLAMVRKQYPGEYAEAQRQFDAETKAKKGKKS